MSHEQTGSFGTVVAQISDWFGRLRSRLAMDNGSGGLSREDIDEIARDCALAPHEVIELMQQPAGVPDLLRRRLALLGLDPDEIDKASPLVLLDLKRVCNSCSDKRRCARELERGVAIPSCPNAMTTDALRAGQQTSG